MNKQKPARDWRNKRMIEEAVLAFLWALVLGVFVFVIHISIDYYQYHKDYVLRKQKIELEIEQIQSELDCYRRSKAKDE